MERAESVSHENFYSLSSLDVSKPDRWRTCVFEILFFLERSDSFLAVFIPFIISTLKWNLCLNGKISEEIQLNGKSCYTMFQHESFLWLTVIAKDFFFFSISWRNWGSCLLNKISDLRIPGNSSKNEAWMSCCCTWWGVIVFKFKVHGSWQ